MATEFPTRDVVAEATKELLQDRFPWKARELASELQYRFGWSLVNKSLINRILYGELSYYVHHDAVRHTWRIR